jgi:hypothetical protein
MPFRPADGVRRVDLVIFVNGPVIHR